MAANRNYVKKDVINETLTSLLQNLKRGSKVISGSLSVAPGHDYWWFLEYGTGQFFDTPKANELVKPEDSRGKRAAGGEYEIEANGAPYLVYMTKYGSKRYIKRVVTIHPGIKPIGMVRTALFEAMIYLKRDVDHIAKRRGKWKDLPKREDLVQVVNDILEVLLGTLKLYTPDNSDPDPAHEGRHPTPLSEAWRATHAK